MHTLKNGRCTYTPTIDFCSLYCSFILLYYATLIYHGTHLMLDKGIKRVLISSGNHVHLEIQQSRKRNHQPKI